MATLEKKLSISIGSAILFLIVNLKETHKLTSKLTNLNLYNFDTNCRTNLGILIHLLLFFGITYLSMSNPNISTGVKLKHSIYGTLIFYLISSPTFYSITNKILNKENDCINNTNVAVHSVIYCIALIGVMYLPEKNN